MLCYQLTRGQLCYKKTRKVRIWSGFIEVIIQTSKLPRFFFYFSTKIKFSLIWPLAQMKALYAPITYAKNPDSFSEVFWSFIQFLLLSSIYFILLFLLPTNNFTSKPVMKKKIVIAKKHCWIF